MATREAIASMLKEIVASYPGRFNLDEDNIKAWTVYLSDIDDDMLVNAVRSFISSSSHGFPPSIPEIRREATQVKRKISGVPDVWEAWEDLLKAGDGERVTITDEQDDEGRTLIERHSYEFKHPIVEKVARGLGWPDNFPIRGNEMSDRAAFRDAYNETISTLTKEDMRLFEVKEYIGSKSLEVNKQIKQLVKGMKP